MSETAPSSSREMRNRAEKQRRDKLNAYISELYSLVPSAAAAPRKLDKTSTLRLSANFLRLHQNVDLRGKPYNRWSAMAGHVILEKLDSFLMAVSCCTGKVIYVSDRVEKLLGHAQVDMMGYQLSCFVHPADLETFEKKLNAFAAQVTSNPETVDALKGQVYSFECRLAGRQLSRGEPTVYERVAISGTFRGPRRRREWADNFIKRNPNSSDFSEPLFIGIVKLLQTPNTLPPLTMMQAVQDEYYTQHTTTGTIIRTDHRIATIAGYFSGEVTGMSAHDYIFTEDLEYTLKAQSLMLSRSEGVVTYRLKTSTGRLIFLRSRGFIQYDENTKEITSFFCINSQIDEKQGLKEIQEMRAMLDKLNINTSAPASSMPLPSNHSFPSLPGTSQRRSITSKLDVNGQFDEAVAAISPQVVVKEFAPIPHESHSLASIENVHSPCESSVSSLHSEDFCLPSTPFSRGSPCLEISNGVELNRSQVPFPWSSTEFSSEIVIERSGKTGSKVKESLETLSIIGTNVRPPRQFVESALSLPSSSSFTIFSNNHQSDVGHKRSPRVKDVVENGKPYGLENSALRKAETNHFEQAFHNGGLKQDAETNSA